MRKSLLVMSLPILALGLTGCDRAEAPKSIKIYGVEAVLKNSNYQYYVSFGGKGTINEKIKWTTDAKETVASIDETTGKLTVKENAVKVPTSINIIATSRADKSIKDTIKVTVCPGESYGKIDDFILDLRNMEEDLYTKYIDKTSSFTVPVLLGEDDYINFLNRKFIPDSTTSRYTLEKSKGVVRIEGGLTSSFLDSRPGSKMKIGKTFQLRQRELVASQLIEYAKKEKEGTGYCNCFRFDSNGDGTYDSIGYYTYAKETEDNPSVFDYMTFKDGLMTTIIEVKNDVVYSYLHVTI